MWCTTLCADHPEKSLHKLDTFFYPIVGSRCPFDDSHNQEATYWGRWERTRVILIQRKVPPLVCICRRKVDVVGRDGPKFFHKLALIFKVNFISQTIWNLVSNFWCWSWAYTFEIPRSIMMMYFPLVWSLEFYVPPMFPTKRSFLFLTSLLIFSCQIK